LLAVGGVIIVEGAVIIISMAKVEEGEKREESLNNSVPVIGHDIGGQDILVKMAWLAKPDSQPHNE